jgi:branched-chain amino acid transport system ATP-binding protein
VVVEQHLSFVLGLADRFAVLKRGEVLDTGPVDANSAARIDEHMGLSTVTAFGAKAAVP